jgi:hypothetical protein
MTTSQLARPQRITSTGVWRAVLAVALAGAGVMHLVLTADHFDESTLMGLGFAGATVVQLGLAAAVLIRPGRWLYAAVIAISAVLITLYVYNVFIGLPFAGDTTAAAHVGEHGGTGDEHDENAAGHSEGGEHDGHHAGGLVLGAGEPVDAAGATTKGAELVSIGVAAGLIIRDRRRTP